MDCVSAMENFSSKQHGMERSLCYGVILSLMNLLIYKAFSYMSVGIAISIEVLGPLAVAILCHEINRTLSGVAYR